MTESSFGFPQRNTAGGQKRKARKRDRGGEVKQLFNHQEVQRPIMKKALFIILIAALALTGAAMAQDVLGPHNVNGHGCASCHAPHSGAAGNGGTDTQIGMVYLWGRQLINKTYTTFGFDPATPTADTFTVPATITDPNDPLFHTAACLSCHDGAVTIVGMNGKSVESVDGGTATAPTYIGTDVTGGLGNDHPVHIPYLPGPPLGTSCPTVTPPAVSNCNSRNWPGTVDTAGKITWGSDASSTDFTTSYPRGVRFYGSAANGGQAMIECSTCHNPHLVNKASVTFGKTVTYKTSRFFIRGWYDSVNPASNSATAFCRQCHFSKSNQYVNVLGVPVT